jgi:hypothetical protein
MFIHYMFRFIRPSSGVKIVVRGSCCVLVFLMVVYLGSLPVFVVILIYTRQPLGKREHSNFIELQF